MELIRGLHNLRPAHRGCAATIGNFDGVHLGHQTVLRQLVQAAQTRALKTTLITFEPLPLEFFKGDQAPARLTRFREKFQLMQSFCLDHMLCLRFNTALSSMPAERFISDILIDGLGLRYLVVGDDFRFGTQRSGDTELLRQGGQRHGFEVVNMHTHELGGERVSSTRVRHALERGDMRLAQALLGRPYHICGHVAHGDKRGRQIGFATANISLGRRVSPLRGVFAVRVNGLGPAPIDGVANIGHRPTVGGEETRLEVHLFDFDADIYGRLIQVDLLHKLRDEQRFESLEALVAQIAQDAQQARRVLQDVATPPNNIQ